MEQPGNRTGSGQTGFTGSSVGSGLGTGAAGAGAGSGADTVDSIVGQAREHASEVTEQVRQRAVSTATTQKDQLAGTLSSVAQALQSAGRDIEGPAASAVSPVLDRLAGSVERVADYLQDRDVNDVMFDSEQFARRNPGLIIAGGFMLGVLGARFLKSSAPEMDRETPLGMYGGPAIPWQPERDVSPRRPTSDWETRRPTPPTPAYGTGTGTGMGSGSGSVPGSSAYRAGSPTTTPSPTRPGLGSTQDVRNTGFGASGSTATPGSSPGSTGLGTSGAASTGGSGTGTGSRGTSDIGFTPEGDVDFKPEGQG